MAIQGKVAFKGITLPSAYVQVVRTWGGAKDGGLQALIRVYADKATRDANLDDFIIEKNLRELAPYSVGQDGLATVYGHLAQAVITPAVAAVAEDFTANPPIVGSPAIPAVTGEFSGFVSC